MRQAQGVLDQADNDFIEIQVETFELAAVTVLRGLE